MNRKERIEWYNKYQEYLRYAKANPLSYTIWLRQNLKLIKQKETIRKEVLEVRKTIDEANWDDKNKCEIFGKETINKIKKKFKKKLEELK